MISATPMPGYRMPTIQALIVRVVRRVPQREAGRDHQAHQQDHRRAEHAPCRSLFALRDDLTGRAARALPKRGEPLADADDDAQRDARSMSWCRLSPTTSGFSRRPA